MIIILYSWACVKPYHDTGMEAPHNLPRRWMFFFHLHFVSFVAVAPGNVCQRVHTDISWLRLPSGLLPRHGRLLGPYIPWICKCAHESLLVFLGPVIFRFKKRNFPFKKKWNSVSIPFHYWQRWIRWNHNISKESAVNGPSKWHN